RASSRVRIFDHPDIPERHVVHRVSRIRWIPTPRRGTVRMPEHHFDEHLVYRWGVEERTHTLRSSDLDLSEQILRAFRGVAEPLHDRRVSVGNRVQRVGGVVEMEINFWIMHRDWWSSVWLCASIPTAR